MYGMCFAILVEMHIYDYMVRPAETLSSPLLLHLTHYYH